MKEMDIAQVARNSGLPASTLRYYEEKGLIRSIGRAGMKRVFNTSVLERLALIAMGRAAGFSLDDIGALLGSARQPTLDRQRLAEQADALDATIRQLSAIRDSLRHAVDCPAEDHLACPTFQRLMKVAARAATREPARRAGTKRRP